MLIFVIFFYDSPSAANMNSSMLRGYPCVTDYCISN